MEDNIHLFFVNFLHTLIKNGCKLRSVIWVNKFFIIIKRNLNKNPQKKSFIHVNDNWLKSIFFRGRSHGCQGNDSFAIFGFLAFLLALLDLYLELGGMLPTIGRKKREISDHRFQQENLVVSNSSFIQTKKSLFLVQVRSNPLVEVLGLWLIAQLEAHWTQDWEVLGSIPRETIYKFGWDVC